MSHPNNDDIPDLSYEVAKAELTDIVAQLESGAVGLEQSMTLWQRGEALAQHCEAWLERAESALDRSDDTVNDEGAARPTDER